MQPLGSRYVLETSIGRGSFGQVWRAHDRTGRPFAVKILRPDLASDPEVLSRFVRERSMIVGLQSPHLVPVHDFVVEGDTLAIVMDLVEGHDLREELSTNGTLPPAQALRITAAVCRGLATVHAAGVVHRDIKPSNILLDPSGDGVTAKITDFGVGWLFDEARTTSTSSLVGTPEYMAPEYALGQPVTPAVDVYAAGIMLYELLCGITPFVGGNPMAVLNRQINTPPPIPADLPSDIRELLVQLLVKTPADRPTAALAATAMTQLAGWLADTPAIPPLPRPAAVAAAGTVGTVGASSADTSSVTLLRPVGPGTGAAARVNGGDDSGATMLRVVPAGPAGSGRRRPHHKALLVAGLTALVLVGGGVAVATLTGSGGDDEAVVLEETVTSDLSTSDANSTAEIVGLPGGSVTGDPTLSTIAVEGQQSSELPSGQAVSTSVLTTASPGAPGTSVVSRSTVVTSVRPATTSVVNGTPTVQPAVTTTTTLVSSETVVSTFQQAPTTLPGTTTTITQAPPPAPEPTVAPPAPEPTMEPPAPDPTVEPPVTEPTVEPPAPDPTVEPPDPTVEPPVTEPTVEPPAPEPTVEPPAPDPTPEPPTTTP